VFINVIRACFCFSDVLSLSRMFLIMPVSSLIEIFVYMFVMTKEHGLVLLSL
jgi:hypothetical protein